MLSWVTPEIDQTEMIEQVLSSDKKQELVRAHSELLKSQAQSFYGGIVEAVDSEIQLKFDFKPELDLCSGFRGFGHVSRLVSRIWASGSGH